MEFSFDSSEFFESGSNVDPTVGENFKFDALNGVNLMVGGGNSGAPFFYLEKEGDDVVGKVFGLHSGRVAPELRLVQDGNQRLVYDQARTGVALFTKQFSTEAQKALKSGGFPRTVARRARIEPEGGERRNFLTRLNRKIQARASGIYRPVRDDDEVRSRSAMEGSSDESDVVEELDSRVISDFSLTDETRFERGFPFQGGGIPLVGDVGLELNYRLRKNDVDQGRRGDLEGIPASEPFVPNGPVPIAKDPLVLPAWKDFLRRIFEEYALGDGDGVTGGGDGDPGDGGSGVNISVDDGEPISSLSDLLGLTEDDLRLAVVDGISHLVNTGFDSLTYQRFKDTCDGLAGEKLVVHVDCGEQSKGYHRFPIQLLGEDLPSGVWSDTFTTTIASFEVTEPELIQDNSAAWELNLSYAGDRYEVEIVDVKVVIQPLTDPARLESPRKGEFFPLFTRGLPRKDAHGDAIRPTQSGQRTSSKVKIVTRYEGGVELLRQEVEQSIPTALGVPLEDWHKMATNFVSDNQEYLIWGGLQLAAGALSSASGQDLSAEEVHNIAVGMYRLKRRAEFALPLIEEVLDEARVSIFGDIPDRIVSIPMYGTEFHLRSGGENESGFYLTLDDDGAPRFRAGIGDGGVSFYVEPGGGLYRRLVVQEGGERYYLRVGDDGELRFDTTDESAALLVKFVSPVFSASGDYGDDGSELDKLVFLTEDNRPINYDQGEGGWFVENDAVLTSADLWGVHSYTLEFGDQADWQDLSFQFSDWREEGRESRELDGMAFGIEASNERFFEVNGQGEVVASSLDPSGEKSYFIFEFVDREFTDEALFYLRDQYRNYYHVDENGSLVRGDATDPRGTFRIDFTNDDGALLSWGVVITHVLVNGLDEQILTLSADGSINALPAGDEGLESQFRLTRIHSNEVAANDWEDWSWSLEGKSIDDLVGKVFAIQGKSIDGVPSYVGYQKDYFADPRFPRSVFVEPSHTHLFCNLENPLDYGLFEVVKVNEVGGVYLRPAGKRLNGGYVSYNRLGNPDSRAGSGPDFSLNEPLDGLLLSLRDGKIVLNWNGWGVMGGSV